MATPAVLTAAGVLLLPGLLIALAAGLRGTAALGVAAPLSVTTLALTAIVAGRLGVPFGIAPLAVATAAAAVTGLASSRFLPSGATRSGQSAGPNLPAGPIPAGRSALAGTAGALIGGACAALAVARGIGRPDVFPQTYDAVFHLSALWQVQQTGDASSLTLGTVAAPGRSAAFYPAAWHGVVALVAQISGAHLVVAVNAVSIAIAALVWPLGCVLLARQFVGPRPGLLFAVGALSAGFGASPYLLLSYGTLWPNALAYALLPAVLACAAAVVLPVPPGQVESLGAQALGAEGLGAEGLGRVRAAVFGLTLLPGLALAHPNAVPSAMIYVGVMALVALGRWGFARPTDVRLRLAATGFATVLAAAELWFVAASPVFAATRHTSWPSRQSLAHAAREWMLSAPMDIPVPWVASALVLIGCLVAVRRPRLRWLVLAHAAAGAAFALVAGSDGPVARALSGPWYDDPFRFAALLGITAVPLAAIGLEAAAAAGLRAARRRAPVLRGLSPQAATGVLTVVVVLLTGALYAGANSRVVAAWYHGELLAGPEETSLLERLPQRVPSGVLIAGNPWNGSPLAAPLGDRGVVFAHLSGSWDPDRALLASSLNRAAELPAVCGALSRLKVEYVLDGPIAFWKGDPRQAGYPGLRVDGRLGFDPVDSGGRLTLYRVTACGSPTPEVYRAFTRRPPAPSPRGLRPA